MIKGRDMKYEAEVRELLIKNTIHLIAEGGFEMATTKNLAHSGGTLPDFKMNEVYIYRLFGSKENLYEAAFLCLDHELFRFFYSTMCATGCFKNGTRENLYRFFRKVWDFILSDEEGCRCYVRYYYSIYFQGQPLQMHKNLFERIFTEAKPLFKEEADVYAILHSTFIMLFDFAIRVYNGELENNEINIPHVFNVLYCMMMTYFKTDAEAQ